MLRPYLRRVSLVVGQILHERDQSVDHVFFVESGFASVMSDVMDGKQVEIAIVGREGMAGLPALLGADTLMFNTVNVQMAGDALKMLAEDLRSCLGATPVLHRRLLRSFEVFIAQASQACACNTLHGMSARLARWLLGAFDCTDDGEITLSHDFLSVMLGATRPAVTTRMHQLAEQGILQYTRSHIRVTDRKALEEASCSCYGRLRTFREAVAGRPETSGWFGMPSRPGE